MGDAVPCPTEFLSSVLAGVKTVGATGSSGSWRSFLPLGGRGGEGWEALALVEKPFCNMRAVPVLINSCEGFQSPEPRPAAKEGYFCLQAESYLVS